MGKCIFLLIMVAAISLLPCASSARTIVDELRNDEQTLDTGSIAFVFALTSIWNSADYFETSPIRYSEYRSPGLAFYSLLFPSRNIGSSEPFPIQPAEDRNLRIAFVSMINSRAWELSNKYREFWHSMRVLAVTDCRYQIVLDKYEIISYNFPTIGVTYPDHAYPLNSMIKELGDRYIESGTETDLLAFMKPYSEHYMKVSRQVATMRNEVMPLLWYSTGIIIYQNRYYISDSQIPVEIR